MKVRVKDSDWVLSGTLGSSRLHATAGVLFTLLGYWYKNSGVLDRLEEAAEKVTDWSDPNLDIMDRGVGIRLLRNSIFYEEFLRFVKNDGFGSFAFNQPAIQEVLACSEGSFGFVRMAIDLGRELRNSPWWKSREKDIKRERGKSRIVMVVQDD